MPSDPRFQTSTTAELVDQPLIADYLNTAITVTPPLQVRGQPPLLQVRLLPVHLTIVGSLLPRLEAALRSIAGVKFWDVSVCVIEMEAGQEVPRLVYHTLIESRPSVARSAITLPPLQTRPLAKPAPEDRLPNTGPTLVAAPSSQSVSLSLKPPSLSRGQMEPAPPDEVPQPPLLAPIAPRAAPSRNKSRPTRAIARSPRRWLSRLGPAIAIIGTSFALGTLVSVGGTWWQARYAQPKAESVTSTPLEPAIEANTPPLEPATNAPSEAASMVPLPEAADTLVAPIASTNGLSVAASSLTVPSPAQVAVQFKAVGDVIPGTDFPNYRLPNDPNYLFNSVKMFMGEVDIVFGNFESTLTNHPYSAKDVSQGMTFAFRTPPNWTDVLKSAGFDVLSVANNHSFDFGDQGFADTITNIQQSGMQAVGRKGDVVKVEANGYTVAFIGYSYWPDHNDMNDLATATALVQQAQSEADMVVISVHAGAEGTDAMRVSNQTEYFFSENRGNMVAFSRAMVDAGADLILGHGPHVPRAVELYQGKLIAYSLGNFLGYRTLSTTGPLGLSMILQIALDDTGSFVKGRVIPVALDQNGVPYIDDSFASVTLVRQLTQQDFPDTPLTIDEMGYILRTD